MRKASEIFNDVSILMCEWLNDDDMKRAYSVEDMQRLILDEIQMAIKSNFIILTTEELQREKEKYHRENFFNY